MLSNDPRGVTQLVAAAAQRPAAQPDDVDTAISGAFFTPGYPGETQGDMAPDAFHALLAVIDVCVGWTPHGEAAKTFAQDVYTAIRETLDPYSVSESRGSG